MEIHSWPGISCAAGEKINQDSGKTIGLTNRRKQLKGVNIELGHY